MNGLFDVTRTKKKHKKKPSKILYFIRFLLLFLFFVVVGLVWFGCLCGSMHLYFVRTVLFYVHDVVFVSITIFHGLHWNYRNVAIPRIFFIHFSAS